MNALQSYFGWSLPHGTINTMPSFTEIKGDDSQEKKTIDFEVQDQASQTIPNAYNDPIGSLLKQD